MKSIAHLCFLLARVNWGAVGSIGQGSSDCSLLMCRASFTHLIEPPFGIIMRRFEYAEP